MKYKNVRKVYDGNIYDSGIEATYAHMLDLQKMGKAIKGYDKQVPFKIDYLGIHICTYIADFVVYPLVGKPRIDEVKGFSTTYFRLKWKLVKAFYGDKYEMRIIKKNEIKI